MRRRRRRSSPRCPGAAVERTALTVAQLAGWPRCSLTWDDDGRPGDATPPRRADRLQGVGARLSLPWPGDGPARRERPTRSARRPSSRSAIPPSRPRRVGGPPPVRRRRVGTIRTLPGPGPGALRARLLEVVPGPSGRGWRRFPTDGGALLVANHAGAIPSDAPVIMHGIEKELGRPVYGLADYFFRTVPVVGTLWARGGGVSARPANAYRLLREQGQLVLDFPEGTKGPSKSFTDRYQLRRFGRGGFVEIAMRAGVPIIPIAVTGSEEAMPVLFRLPGRGQGARAPLLPGDRQPPGHGAARHGGALPGQVQPAGPRPRLLRCAAGSGALLQEPRHGGGRAHPHRDSGVRLRHAARRAAACGSAEGSAPWPDASSSPEPTPSGVGG